MTLLDVMQEVKERYTKDFMNTITTRDRKGTGYVCPFCGSGSKKNGTGMKAGTEDKNFYTCFNCHFKGDMFDFIKALYHCDTLKEQIQKAEELLHRQFLSDNNTGYYKRETPKTNGKEVKNMVQNNDNLSNDNKNTVQNNEELRLKTEKLREFMQNCRTALPASQQGIDYLKARGISENTAFKYYVGYTDKYGDGMNTPAIIIPTGKASYTARSITTNESSRKIRKKNAGGRQGIFNIKALQEPSAVIFLVEGEFDALSILEAGYPAICTGGGTSEAELLEQIKESPTRPEMFVIIPDNDRNDDGTPDDTKGRAKGEKLLNGLLAAGIPAKMVDSRTWHREIKDVNDYLIKDRAEFVNLLHAIVEPIESAALRKLGRAADYMQDFKEQIVGKTPPIKTGFKQFDDLLSGGLHPGLIVMGAISSLGKTTYALNLADNMAAAGQDVLFFSLEMSRFELLAKSISRKTFEYCKRNHRPAAYAKSNLGVSDFDRYTNYNDTEQAIIEGCMDEYERGAARNLYIIEGRGNVGTAQIREAVRKHIALTGNRPVVVCDYMQILSAADPRSTDKQNTDRNVVELKRISRDFNIPVIGISSFNRENYTEPVTMSAFKESGCIEYTSDVLIGLQYDGMDYREEKQTERTARIRELFKTAEINAKAGDKIDIQIKVLKNRSGGKGNCIFKYYPMFNCYIE